MASRLWFILQCFDEVEHRLEKALINTTHTHTYTVWRETAEQRSIFINDHSNQSGAHSPQWDFTAGLVLFFWSVWRHTSLFPLPLFYPAGTQTHHKVKWNVGFDHVCNENVLKAHFDIMVHVLRFKCGLWTTSVCHCVLPYCGTVDMSVKLWTVFGLSQVVIRYYTVS